MAVVWTIAGQAGKNVDEVPRSLAALQAEGSEINFESLDSDKLTWSVFLERKEDFEDILPELGQKITLFRNGARYFTGTVTRRPIRFSGSEYRADVVVEGPWWYLRQIPLSSDVPDQDDDASERTAYVFPTGSPRTHLIALIARAIALGAPISQGSIASCFSIPRASLRNIAFSEAISELMRWVADGIPYFDYTAAGEPALAMQRRTPATTITLNPANVTVGDISIAPRLDLQVEELKVFYAKRQTVGDKRLTVWESETAGALTSGLPRRQPALISGPEVDTYLPQDFTDSVVVRAALLRDTFGRVKGEVFAQFDERLRAAGAINFGVGTFSAATIGGGTFNLKSIPTTVTDSEGNPVDPAFNRYLIVGESRDWWTKDGIEHVKARIAATIYTRVVYAIPGSATPPAWADIMGSQVYGFVHPSGTESSAVYATTVSVPVTLVKTDWAVDTTLIRAEDYAFVQPPVGLAANLLATQNWLPYEGSVGPVAIGDIPAGNLVGSVLNLSGFLSETANMRALISGYTVRPAAGTVTFRLGAPSRFAYRDLVNRFRQSGADNIVWLVDSVSGDPGENPPPDPELEIPAGPDFSILYTDSFLVFDGDFIAFTP